MRMMCSVFFRATPVIILTAIALLSCGPGGTSSTEAALSTTEVLIESLDDLSDSTQQCEASVTDAVRTTQADLGMLPAAIDGKNGLDASVTVVEEASSSAGAKPRLGGIAQDWEQRWNIVEQQANLIESRFDRVEVASNNYWSKVDSITDAINDDELRDRETSKNVVARKSWDEVHQRAAAQIGKIQELRAKGQDFLRVMQLAAMREDLGRHAEELKAISDDAESILAELKNLSESGRSLIASE
jgi:hypothetical protein